MRVALRFVAGTAVLLWAVCAGGFAQTAVDGGIAGRVTMQAAAPGSAPAIVWISFRRVDDEASAGQKDHPPERSIWTADGRFMALRLPVGTYVVEATLQGKLIASTSVQVELGGLSEVTLSPLLARPSLAGSSATGLADGILRELPVEDRRWENVAQTISEVNEASGSAEDEGAVEEGDDSRWDGRRRGLNAGALLSFRGIAPTQNVTLVDGVSGDQAFRGGARGGAAGGPRAQSSFAEGSVRAFRVAPHSYSAQYGGGAGGLLTTVSRGGADGVHGSGFYVARRSAWDAANPYSIATRYRDGVVSSGLVKPQDSLDSVGGRLGVGVWGKRLFALLSAEVQFRNFPAQASPSLPEFYQLSPTQVALLGNRGVTASARTAALNYLDSLAGEVPRSSRRDVEFARMDVRPGAQDTLVLSYGRSRFSFPAGVGGGASAAVVARGRASVGDQTIRTDAATLRWLHIFGAKLTNEVRGQFARDLEFEQPRAPLLQEPAISPGGFAPQVSIRSGDAGGFTYGTPAALGRNAYPDEQRVEAADLLQWAAGKHLFTLGAEWSRVDERIDALNNLDGTFTYDSGTTSGHAGGLVDWIADYTFSVNGSPRGACPSINATLHYYCFRSFTQSFGQQQTEFVLHQFAGFAQDLWRIRPGLTAELGARYEYTLLPLPQTSNAGLDAVFSGIGATSVFPEDRNNIGPRASVAWSPHGGRWGVVRVGYGAYFGRLPGGRVRAALENTALPTSSTHIRIRPTTVTACPQVANQGFGFPCAYVTAPPAAVATTTSASIFAKNFRLPMVQQAELTLERDVARGVSLRATYSMANATQLPNTRDVNIAASTSIARYQLQGGDGRAGVSSGEMFAVPLYTARVSSSFGPVTALESNANATWHGLTVEARARRGKLQAHGSYTWSKAIDYGAEQGVTPRVNSQFDPFAVGYDKGLADSNFSQRFAGDVTWESFLQRGDAWLRRLASGWRASGIGTAGSGRPYSYEVFGGNELSGGAESINGSGGSAFLPTVGRNTLRLPMRWNVDARIGRGFRVERVRGLAYVEAFNLANHLNAARVNTRAFLVGDAVSGVTPLIFQNAAAVAAEGLNTPAFGNVTSSTTGLSHERSVQAGIRLDF